MSGVFLGCVCWNELCRADRAPLAETLALLPVVLALSSAERLGPRQLLGSRPCACSPALHMEACVSIFLLCVFSQVFKES